LKLAREGQANFSRGPIHGGKFWRFTPMVNWHLSDHVRLELTYGYGRLHRFDLTGNTHFFQSRLQLTL
jgi:phosphate-selective porin OprO and OprP